MFKKVFAIMAVVMGLSFQAYGFDFGPGDTAKSIAGAVSTGAQGIGDAVNIGLGGVQDVGEIDITAVVEGSITTTGEDESHAETSIGTASGVKGVDRLTINAFVGGDVTTIAKKNSSSKTRVGTVGR